MKFVPFDESYHRLVNSVIDNGERKETRAGPTRQVFGACIQISELSIGLFPLLTSRKMYPMPVLGELAAFLRGATDLKTFKEFGCNYWDANAAAWSWNEGVPQEYHKVGQIYGAQWRNWRNSGYDQLTKLCTNLRLDPHSRRHLLTTYDPEEKHACLPPCHLLAQFNVTSGAYLECTVYMRSVDLCVGLPSDVILYAALLALIAEEVDLKPGNLIFMLGDTHVYENHVELWNEKQRHAAQYTAPQYSLRPIELDSFFPDCFTFRNYMHGDKIVYPFNV